MTIFRAYIRHTVFPTFGVVLPSTMAFTVGGWRNAMGLICAYLHWCQEDPRFSSRDVLDTA